MNIAAASGNSLVDDALSGLQTNSVYVSPEVAGAAKLQAALESTVPADGSIAVVVLPADAKLDNPYSTWVLDQITGSSGYKTVVIALDGDLQADSVAIDGDEAMRIANQNETAAGGDVQTALTETVQQISAEMPDAPSGGDGAAGLLVPGVIGGVVVVAVAVTAIGVLARRRRRAPVAIEGGMPPAIRARVDRLRELRVDYAGLPGHPVAAETATGIDALASHVEQLFARLGAKAGEHQSSLAEAEYSDKLARLVAALDRDYLLDLLTHPELWDAPDERIGEVREALTAVSTQIVDNIKQVNARKGLMFQVSLDSLIGRSELRDWERQFKSNSGE
ncbi:MAG: hypothetical protein P0Y60_02090 [Candidatus Microbacterium colombiense]|nr:MAG: hypothetical protein P0Y60_02090 [Microbacterium sp.]